MNLNCTWFPDALLERIHEFMPSEWKLISVLIHEVHKGATLDAALTISSLEARTGMTRPTVLAALGGLLKRTEVVAKKEKNLTTVYSLPFQRIPVISPTEETVIAISKKSLPHEKEQECRNALNMMALEDNGKKSLLVQGFAGLLSEVDSTGTKKETVKRARSKKLTAEEIQVHVEVNRFKQLWLMEFKTAKGHDYLMTGWKEMAAMRKLVGHGLGPQGLIDIAKQAWIYPDGFYCRGLETLTWFSNYINNIRGELRNKNEGIGSTKHRTDGNLGTSNEGQAHLYRDVGAVVPVSDNE